MASQKELQFPIARNTASIRCESPKSDNLTRRSLQVVYSGPSRAETANAPIDQTTKTSACNNLDALFQDGSFEQHYQPDSTILLHGDTADAVYQIVSGTVRCCTIDANGVRQIFYFAQKGDFLGISDPVTWHFTAEAIDHVILRAIPRMAVEQSLAVNASLRQEVRSLLHDMLVQRERQLLSLISQKAPERLLGFLRDFAAKRPRSVYIVLPMCRRDIADHLGMTPETVSRAFAALKASSAIEMSNPEKFRLLV